MGAWGDNSLFRTYRMRLHDTSGWRNYFTDTGIGNACGPSGYNSGIEHCDVLDTNGWPGMYIWTWQ